jgi:hypothetical protein
MPDVRANGMGSSVVGTEISVMQLPRMMMKRWIVVTWLLFLIVLLTLWTIRPGACFYLLGLEGVGKDAPLRVIREWLAGAHAPLSPTGCLSLFPAFDLLLAGALLTGVAILLIVLAAPSSDDRPGSWFTKDVGVLGRPGFGLHLRTMLLLIAIVGLVLGWETVARRRWRQHGAYLA